MKATVYLRWLVTLTMSAALLAGTSLARADGMTTEQAQEMLNELKAIRKAVENMQAPQQAQAPAANDKAPILTGITTNCNLAPVSWVIPDGNWSDHNGGAEGGPALPGDGGPS